MILLKEILQHVVLESENNLVKPFNIQEKRGQKRGRKNFFSLLWGILTGSCRKTEKKGL